MLKDELLVEESAGICVPVMRSTLVKLPGHCKELGEGRSLISQRLGISSFWTGDIDIRVDIPYPLIDILHCKP